MDTGKLLMGLGAALIVLGALWWAGGRLGLGRLPGDIAIKGERGSFYFPITTCIVLSILLSLVMWLVGAIRR